eukprot:TRINITY_DN8636_c0_g1_i2.p1 TRINITY_DN8636_c0_g1~~TRINITY_DN8636_c0_g1_i2.p1  ORF type:complete len:160 (+),score=42.22 TRINITY_DN8636_c0_g1_i2:201-680(+)
MEKQRFTVEKARQWLDQMTNKVPLEALEGLPVGFYEALFVQSLQIDVVEPGRILCSLEVPSCLINSTNSLHGGAIATFVDIIGSAAIFTTGSLTSGVSVEINVSYLDAASAGEEIEIEAKSLRVGRAFAYVTVDLRKKKTGKLIAQGRHTKYLAASSRL